MKQFRKMTYPYVVWISIMIVIPMLLIMFYVEDLTQEEIAEKLNVSVSKIKRECKRYGIHLFRILEKGP